MVHVDKKQKQSNSLEQLKATGTVVVSDTGDFESIAKYTPQDATTNPSLILAAARKEAYAKLIDTAVEYGKKHGKTLEEKTDQAVDMLLVEFGKAILQIVPGRVSTEVDARLSFDKDATVAKASFAHYQSVRRRRYQPRKSTNQNRLHLGGYPSRQGVGGEAQHPRQLDAAVLFLASRCRR